MADSGIKNGDLPDKYGEKMELALLALNPLKTRH
jgi:hypothetical protein